MARLAAAVGAALALATAGTVAAPAPTAGSIVFSVFAGLPAFDGNEACEGLYVAEPDGSGLRRLTGPSVPGYHGHFWPAVSPDGGRIVFGVSGGTTVALHVLVAGSSRMLAELPFPAAARWSPRGDAVVVPVVLPQRIVLRRIDAATGRARNLTAGLHVAFEPTWSPTGARLAFTERGGARSTLRVMNADGSGLRRLVRDAFGPAWSSHGLIAHFRGRAGETADLWTMRPDGSDARLRVRGAFYRGSHSLVWSPDGSSLLFLRRPNARDYYPGIEYSVGDVVRLQLAQQRTRVVARRAIPLAWLSDGRLLVLRPRTIAGELVFAVVTLAQDDRRERVVGVTDEEDVNIGSFPAWQPRRAPLRTALAPFDPRPEWQYCLDRLRRLRASLG